MIIQFLKLLSLFIMSIPNSYKSDGWQRVVMKNL